MFTEEVIKVSPLHKVTLDRKGNLIDFEGSGKLKYYSDDDIKSVGGTRIRYHEDDTIKQVGTTK